MVAIMRDANGMPLQPGDSVRTRPDAPHYVSRLGPGVIIRQAPGGHRDRNGREWDVVLVAFDRGDLCEASTNALIVFTPDPRAGASFGELIESIKGAAL